MNSTLRLAASLLATIVAVGTLEGCAGRGALDSNQVVVRLEDYGSVASAIPVAQDTCARRGGRGARLVAVIPSIGSHRLTNGEPSLPDAVFACDPQR